VTAAEDQVSWKTIERDAVVVAADGSEAARVVEVAGDLDADIFSGLVVRAGALDAKRFLPAERVRAIWARRVQVDLTPEAIAALAPFEEPVVARLEDKGGFFSRLRRLLG
jgi:hypothetical protein